jgi:hypothetical protein
MTKEQFIWHALKVMLMAFAKEGYYFAPGLLHQMKDLENKVK